MLSPPAGAHPDWRQRWHCLVHKIERVQTRAQAQQLVAALGQPERPFVLAFANAHAMNSLVKSAPFFNALHSADMVLRDGSGMAALFKLLGLHPGLNLNGTDLIPQLIRLFDGRCIAFFGTQEPHLQRAVQAGEREFAPRSRFVSAHGFHDTGVYLGMALLHKPALFVLGMGMPRQEEVAAALRATVAFPCLIVCGGAIIDFLGGKTPRAPLWLRERGLEWVYRLAIEPRRLFQRYVIGNPLFLSRALRLASFRRS
jgi:N-acetylglucosaminyldiphosphoundecaprenol N-acetyl-beta-D-mannosaminyltransferase